FGAGGVQGAIVLDTSDSAKAGSFLDSQAKHAGARANSYRGVSYRATSSGVAFGVVAHFAVIGSETGLQDVIDTTRGGPALAHATPYSKLLASAPSGRPAHRDSNTPGAGPDGGRRARVPERRRRRPERRRLQSTGGGGPALAAGGRSPHQRLVGAIR